MIQAHVRMVVPQEKRDEIERALRSRVGRTRAVRGCLDCRLYREVEDEDALLLTELWDDHAAWQRHAVSDSFREVLMLVELSPQPPEIVFRRIEATWDLSYLEVLQGRREASGSPDPKETRTTSSLSLE